MTAPATSEQTGTVIQCSNPDHPIVVELDGTTAIRLVFYWSDFTRVGLTPVVKQRVKVRGTDGFDSFICGAAEEGEIGGSGI